MLRGAAIGLAGTLLLLQPIAGAVAAGHGPGDVQLAQAPPPPPSGGGESPQEQAAEMQRALQITPAQQLQFQAFVGVMQQNDAAMSALMRRYPPGQQRSALAELQAQSEAADAEAAGLKRLVAAFQALYSSLSPSQRQAADQFFAAPPSGGQPPPR